MTALVISAIYLLGSVLSYRMLKVENEAEGERFTIGDQLISFTLSLLSFLMVFTMLISAWYGKIKKTGYWDKPLNEKPR